MGTKKINIETNKETKAIHASVELPKRHLAKEEVQTFSNADMIAYLKAQGVKLEEYESEPTTSPTFPLTSYSTKNVSPRLSGEWVFSKKTNKNEIKTEVQTSKKSRVKKTTNS